MLIKYLGHSAFLMKNREGTRIITDPYSPTQGVNYKPIEEDAEIVTVSHDHWDHNNTETVGGNPRVIKKETGGEIKGIRIRGISTYHDTSKGKDRGGNIIFIFEVDGIRICHLGDLGHELTEEQISLIGDIDICLIPVGGTYTIGPEKAKKVIDAINPKIAIPMHFKTPSLNFPVTGVEDFLRGLKDVRRINSSEFEIDKDQLPPHTNVVVLNPSLL